MKKYDGPHPVAKGEKTQRRTRLLYALYIGLIILCVPVVAVIARNAPSQRSKAAGPALVTLDSGNGQRSGNVSVHNDSTAAGGNYIRFNQPPAPTPTPTPTPTPSGRPSASNTGVPAGTSLKTISGTQYVESASWFSQNGFSGSGTSSSPWVIDKALVTGLLYIDVGNSKYVTVKRSRIYGNSVYGVEVRSGTVVIEDSTIGPNVTPGNSSQKNDKGVRAYAPTTVRRSNIFNNEVQVSLEGNGPWLVEDNYLHHTWFAPGAHTGVININYWGSNGVIRGNTIDGIRNDGGYAHNGVSIYNDGHVSTNWLIEGNYFDRNQFHIYTAVNPPHTIRNNVLTTRFQTSDKWYFYGAISGWTDGGGNKDENGKALPIKNR